MPTALAAPVIEPVCWMAASNAMRAAPPSVASPLRSQTAPPTSMASCGVLRDSSVMGREPSRVIRECGHCIDAYRCIHSLDPRRFYLAQNALAFHGAHPLRVDGKTL